MTKFAKTMNFCCPVAKSHFDARNECGFFLFAAVDSDADRLRYYSGYTAAHKEDYMEGVGTCNALREAMQSGGVSNFKPLGYRSVKFCSSCGANLSEYYGSDGELLRDDDFLRRLTE